MGQPSASDKRFLEQHRGKWRVSISVPRDLVGQLGTRLKRPLETDSLAVANRVKWAVVAELRAEIDRARGDASKGSEALVREAAEIARQRMHVRREDEAAGLDEAVDRRVHEILGKPIGEGIDPQTGRPEPMYAEEREEQARQFLAVAGGKATPIDLHHPHFIAQAQNKKRTEGDDRRAMKFLLEWCKREEVRPVLQAITPRVAIRFMDDLSGIAGGHQSPTTLNKYLGRLSGYWVWLLRRHEVDANVWHGVKLAEPKLTPLEQERAFTDAEVATLLNGAAEPRMHDLMRIGALTGARLDAIVDLKVRDCADGLFTFKPQKAEPAARAVPIHPVLLAIIERRTHGKGPDDDVFPEWPAPKRVGSVRERSFKASNQFTDYRRAVGVDVVVPGKRRSLVNFHSFRRWFITKAEQADQPESIIAAVVGHKRKGMTLGRYSAGPLVAQARRCVEAVELPEDRRSDTPGGA